MSKTKIIGVEKHAYAPELTKVLYRNGASVALNKLIKNAADLNSALKMLYCESNRVSIIIKFIRQSLRRSTDIGKRVTIYRIDNKCKTNVLVAQGYYFHVSVIKKIIDKDFLKHGLLSSEYKTIITYKIGR